MNDISPVVKSSLHEKPGLAIIISRGEALRNFIYTGISDELRKHYRLIFFSVIPNAHLHSYLLAKSDVLYELKEKVTLHYNSRILMQVTDLAHNRVLGSAAAKLRWELRAAEAKGKRESHYSDKKLAEKARQYRTANTNTRLYDKIKKGAAVLLSNQFMLHTMDKLITYLARKEPAVQEYKTLLEKEKPVLLFNTSHIHSPQAYPVLHAAKQLNIPVLSFLFSWDNLTSQGRIFPLVDYYFSWNKKIAADLLRIYPRIRREQVDITGTPQFNFHFNTAYLEERAAFMHRLGLPADRKYIIYSAGLSHNIPYEDIIAERIAAMLLDIDPAVVLVIRTYAKDPVPLFDRLRSKPNVLVPPVSWEPNFSTPLQEDQFFYTNLLRYCELGINVGSTIGLELCMFDKPAIFVGYDPPGKDISPISYERILNFDHLRPIVQSGGVAVARSEAEMQQLLKNYLDNPALDSDKRNQLMDDFFERKEHGVDMLVSTESIVTALRNRIDNIINR